MWKVKAVRGEFSLRTAFFFFWWGLVSIRLVFGGSDFSQFLF